MQFSLLFLQTAAPTSGITGALGQALPLVIMIPLFYFLFFMPMQRQKKQQAAMLKGLQNGQNVVTTGGIVGTIIAVNSDDTLILRVKPDNIKLQVSRSSVTSLVSSDEAKK
jgi:preprotein translocase subunit YajC